MNRDWGQGGGDQVELGASGLSGLLEEGNEGRRLLGYPESLSCSEASNPQCRADMGLRFPCLGSPSALGTKL